MLRRNLFIILAVIALAALGAQVCAQSILAVPSVRGSGAIAVNGANGTTVLGVFTINVSTVTNPTGAALAVGSFRYTQASPASTAAGLVIYTQKIVSLQVVGNVATVKAVGYCNGVLSNLTLVAGDNTPTSTGAVGPADTLQITASPASQGTNPVPMYCLLVSGPVVRGDIAVTGGSSYLGWAKGTGTIPVTSVVATTQTYKNTGYFNFVATKVGNVVNGSLTYTETNPLLANPLSPIVKPIVQILLPAVQSLQITGNTATITGRGTLNGLPATITAVVFDGYSPLPGPTYPDQFSIKATVLTVSPATVPITSTYYVPLTNLSSGDIVVHSNQ